MCVCVWGSTLTGRAWRVREGAGTVKQLLEGEERKKEEYKRTGNRVCVTSSLLSTSQLLLPVHLVEEILGAQEEVVDLAALLVALSGVVDAQLGLLREELADVWHREDYLLHGAVQTHDLDTTRGAGHWGGGVGKGLPKCWTPLRALAFLI